MLQDLISLFFPNVCAICNAGLAKGEQLICTTCLFDLPKTDFHAYIENPLFQRLRVSFPLNNAFAYLHFTKGGKAQTLLHKLKYKELTEVGETLGRWYGHDLRLKGFHEKIDLVIPVPLHVAKMRKRGYNQSDFIAKGIAEGLGVEWSTKAIKRIALNETQTKKRKVERHINVSNIFSVTDKKIIESRNVLIVDDVITTGATILSCAEVAQNANCKGVSIGALAVAKLN